MESDRKCKGSVMLDIVKVVRAFRDLDWGEYLKPEDWEIIDAMVIPTEWYPIDSYMRIGMAVYKVVAKGGQGGGKDFRTGRHQGNLRRGLPAVLG